MADASSKTSGSSSGSSMQSPNSSSFSSAPVAPVVTRDSHSRSREWSKKPPPKRRASKRKDESEESEEEEGEEEEEDVEDGEESEAEDEAEAVEVEDGEETGSDSDRDRRKKKLTTKKPAETKRDKEEPAKRDAKDKKHHSKATAPPPRRKPTVEKTYQSDGSETSSQADTDDDMTGRGASREPPAEKTHPSSTKASSNNSTSRTSSPVMPRERNSSMTLPSLSRAAMIHMSRRETTDNERSSHANSHSSSSGSGSGAGRVDKRGSDSAGASGPGINNRGSSASQNPGWRRDRSRSRSRERPEPSGGSRWNDNQMKYTERNDDMTGESDGVREDEPPSPGQDGEDVRIMFHGREIYADDLIGLRVAKTFVGHGRFLGQVVKFDEPTSLYTIVYADGDAEELSIENTIQILIQDEIERADPSVPPASSGYRNDRIPDSPEIGSVTPSSSFGVGAVPVAPLNPSGAASQASHHSASSQNAMPTYPSRRSSVAISEREAQFVIGLFENHALPVLMRQGWRTQKHGPDQRFYAPPGNFRGAGHMFASALDVVELIAFDNELLSACFPQNVHSAILSLFPESTSASRKRGSSTAPTEAMDGYDSKRVRGGREGYSNGPVTAPMARVGAAGGSAVGPAPGRIGGLPDDQIVPPVSYRPDDRERERERGDRDGYNGPQRMPAPLTSGERFPSSVPGRGEPSDSYRRPSGAGGDYRSMPLRPLSADGGPPPGSSSSSRWGGPQSGAPDSGEYHHRRGYGDGPEWHERDQISGGGGYMGDHQAGGYRGEDGRAPGGGSYYGGDRGLSRGGSGGPGIRSGGPPGGPAGEAHSSYGRYRDARGPQAPSSSGQYSPGPDSYSNRYPPSRGEPPAGEFRGNPGAGSGGAPPPGMSDRFARPLSRGGSGGPSSLIPPGPGGPSGGGRGFSMMDVDRNATNGSGSGSSSYEHHRMERGRSPHQPDSAGPPPGSSGSYGGPPGHYGHHQRSGSNGSQPNPAN